MSMKNTISFIWEVVKIVLVALVIVVPIRYFLFQPFLVDGESMEPNFEEGDYLIVDELSYRMREPKRGEVIVFKAPSSPSTRYIKRIIGLPGETVEIKDGIVMVIKDNQAEIIDESTYLPKDLKTVGNTMISIPDNEFFVLGDNRSVSSDSRTWGLLPRKNIIGRVYVRVWPFTAFAKIEKPTYEIING